MVEVTGDVTDLIWLPVSSKMVTLDAGTGHMGSSQRHEFVTWNTQILLNVTFQSKYSLFVGFPYLQKDEKYIKLCFQSKKILYFCIIFNLKSEKNYWKKYSLRMYSRENPESTLTANQMHCKMSWRGESAQNELLFPPNERQGKWGKTLFDYMRQTLFELFFTAIRVNET